VATTESSETASKLPPRRPREIDQCVDRFLTTMCDTSRRYILELLASPQEDPDPVIERRSGEIARLIGLSAATTSEHLRQLSSLGLIRSRREGNVVYYRISNQLVARSFHDFLTALDLYCTSLRANDSP
jgi:DNA-binding transcriptional ArsR family regulator